VPYLTEWWKNIVEPDRPQMTIWRMSAVCWITRAKLGICSTYWFSTATVVTRSRLSVTLYVHGLLYLNTSNCTSTSYCHTFTCCRRGKTASVYD